MSRKKSRTEDRIGIPKSNTPRVSNAVEKPKAKSGNKSGSRQQLAEAILASQRKRKKDPRSGSKKPIDLSKYAKTQHDMQDDEYKMPAVSEAVPVLPTYTTTQAEFDAIEADKLLEDLLEKQDAGKLNAEEEAYVEKMTSRYAVLCELLGIDVNDYSDEEQENVHEDDPFASLDAIKIDDFKD